MAAGAYTSDPKAHHITNLVQLGLCFCLSYCKYTNCTGPSHKIQFRTLLDSVLFIGYNLLPVDAPIEHFYQANYIVIILDNQKNTIRGETISHFQSYSTAAYLVRSGVNIFLRLREHGCDPTTPVGGFPTDQGL